MKGFPNQLAEIPKIQAALRVVLNLIQQGQDPGNDDILGEALVRARVLGAGHGGRQNIAAYLAAQRQKRSADRAPSASARGILEFLSCLGVIRRTPSGTIELPLAQQLLAADPATPAGRAAWHTALEALAHADRHGNNLSHPYAVLLRLVSRVGSLPKGLSPLALEANNDSEAELNRIIGLAGLVDENTIKQTIGTTDSNWANGKKVLGPLAMQVGALVETNGYLSLGAGVAGQLAPAAPAPAPPPPVVVPRPAGRTVDASTIANVPVQGPARSEEEAADPQETAAMRLQRTTRHQEVVRALAVFIGQRTGLTQFRENPMDLLAFADVDLLVEVKTLDGTADDEIARVRAALAQLYYYRYFDLDPSRRVAMAAVFSQRPRALAHEQFLAAAYVAVVWESGGEFFTTVDGAGVLGEPWRSVFGVV